MNVMENKGLLSNLPSMSLLPHTLETLHWRSSAEGEGVSKIKVWKTSGVIIVL